MTGLNSAAVIQAAVDHLAQTGLFETVQGHEALSSPGNGLAADAWAAEIRPIAALSGLDVTSAMLLLQCRIYYPANAQPADGIETTVMGAVDTLMTAYSGEFTLGGLVMEVDLLGEYGTSLSAVAGYVSVGDIFYRCMTITVPCVLADVWPQTS